MRRILFVLSLLLLLTVVAVHTLALFDAVPEPWIEPSMLLHVLSLFLFIGSFLYFMVSLRKAPPKARASTWNYLRARGPRWLQISLALILLYAAGGFAANILFSGTAQPANHPRTSADGGDTAEPEEYSIQNHGTVVARLNKSEYLLYRNAELAGFSSIWILFVAVATYLNFPQKSQAGAAEPNVARSDSTIVREGGNGRGWKDATELSATDVLQSADINSPRFPSHFQSSTVIPVSWLRRSLAGGYGFLVGWTGFLAFVFGAGGLLLEIYFLLVPAVMFGVVTWLNFRFRKKQMRFLILEASVDSAAANIRFMDGNKEVAWNESLQALKPRIVEKVIRGNSLFQLEIDSRAGTVIQSTCKQWSYESLEALALALGAKDLPT